MQFTRGGSLLVDRARLIDLLACACSTLLVVWVFVDRRRGQLGKISAADVIGDLLLIAVAVRLVVAAGRNLSAMLLLTGAAGMLVSDVVYPLCARAGSPRPGTSCSTWPGALAALHPSMTGLTEPMPPRPTPVARRWAVLLGVSVATPPVVLLIEASTARSATAW